MNQTPEDKRMQDFLSKKPIVNGSGSSNAHDPEGRYRLPYYREEYALSLKPECDAMMGDTVNDRKFLCSDFGNISVTTLYLRLLQSFQYLVDNYDKPELKLYTRLKANTFLKKEEDGVTLSWKRPKSLLRSGARKINGVKSKPMVSHLVSPDEEIAQEGTKEPSDKLPSTCSPANWRKGLEDYLEISKDGDIFYVTGLELEEKDIQIVKVLLAPFEGEVSVIFLEPSRIKLFRGKLPEGME